MLPFVEWLLVGAEKYTVESYLSLLALLCRNIQSITPSEVGLFGSLIVDMLEAVAFIKSLISVKYTIFSTDTGL